MYIFKKTQDLQNYLAKQKGSIGFVPTMGALHIGHLSLMEKAKKENTLCVCSIFVNPTQFNDKKDFEKYPITLESDIAQLIAAEVDVLFLPEVEEMYPLGTERLRTYDIGYLDTVLDGKFRPGHFNGVCLIVHRLLEAVKPQLLYLGEKDFQQCLVINQLVSQLNLPIQVITCPTYREKNGLAMSSRNARLSAKGKEAAGIIYQTLNSFKENKGAASFKVIYDQGLANLSDQGFDVEYLLLANSNNLLILDEFEENTPMVVLIACKFEGVRLIDNLRI
ncbi:MAG: pantoate--beta-alanine ligase [Chitinophagaceae bacterium]|nr:pantoate--beta-alanine ligase [Chitinophagaceae bacterium]